MQLILGTAAAFTLVCSGTATNVNSDLSEPYEAKYSIDLDQGIWCEGQCRVMSDIVNVTDDTITLRNGPIPRYRGSSIWRSTIDRRTGEHLEERLTTSTVVITGRLRRGQCREEPFAGFPDSSG
jgi:hypothetical protein